MEITEIEEHDDGNVTLRVNLTEEETAMLIRIGLRTVLENSANTQTEKEHD